MFQNAGSGSEPENQQPPDQNFPPGQTAGSENPPQIDNEPIDLSGEEIQTNRRGFLFKAALDVATVIGTAHLIGVLPPEVEIRADEVVDDVARRPGDYWLIDSDLKFESGNGFRNFGVEHVGYQFVQEREHILKAIRECDVLLLEGCAGQEYFDFMAGLAFHEGKRVVRLEANISPIFSAGFVGSSFGRLFVGFSNMLHFGRRVGSFIFGGDDSPPESPLRVAERIEKKRTTEGASDADYRSIAAAAVRSDLWSKRQRRREPSVTRTALTWATELGTRMFVGVPGVDTAWVNGAYKSDDYSHLVDGRTVLMLGEVRNFVENNPGEKVLVISGDMHATGFNYYLQDAAHRAEFDEKLAHYRDTYKRVFGGDAAEERDPAESLAGFEPLFD